ncbi:MAG: hypothetical protein ACPGVB_07915 [Chitinophagales bacterium]
MKYTLTFLICLFWIFTFSFAQTAKEDVDNYPAYLVHVDYGYQIPSGDLADRFGNNSNIGAGLLYKTKNNWLFGADGYFMFGTDIKENFSSNLLTTGGFVLGTNGLYAELNSREQGFCFMGKIGKLFSMSPVNPNTGFTVLLGAGYLQHKIQIEDRNNAVPQFQDEYRKGYDRLTSGLAFSQFIGYTHLSLNRRINFYIGIEAIQAFTQGRRSTNFNNQTNGTGSRTDILFGPKVGWILPIYREPTDKFHTD